MADEDDFYNISKDSAHPGAVGILREDWFWDSGDPNSPFGNADGAEALVRYQKWRDSGRSMNAITFFWSLFVKYGIDPSAFLEITDAAELEQNYDEIPVHVYDNTAIAIAFAQIYFGDKVDREIKRLALLAIERQKLPLCLGYYADFDQEQRTQRLDRMAQILVEQEDVFKED